MVCHRFIGYPATFGHRRRGDRVGARPCLRVCGRRGASPDSGEAWSLRGRNSRLPQDRRSGLARASVARRARRAAHRMCAVQFALISTICPSFSLNMTGYSPQMRGKWWSDIEFSLSRLSTAQTPCLAPTLPCRCNRLSNHLRARREVAGVNRENIGRQGRCSWSNH